MLPGHSSYVQAKIEELPNVFAEKLAAREQLTGPRFISKWTVAIICLFVGVAVVTARSYATENAVNLLHLGGQIVETTRSTNEKVSSFLEEARERVAASTDDAEKDLEAMREEVALKAKELEEKGKEFESKDRTSWDLEVCSM